MKRSYQLRPFGAQNRTEQCRRNQSTGSRDGAIEAGSGACVARVHRREYSRRERRDGSAHAYSDHDNHRQGQARL